MALHDLPSFDALIEQRKDAVGAEGRHVTINGFGQEWRVAVPGLQSAAWNDTFDELNEDVNSGVIATTDFRAEMCDLMLGEQAEDFIHVCDENNIDPVILLTGVLQEMVPGNSRKTSRGGRRPQKRR